MFYDTSHFTLQYTLPIGWNLHAKVLNIKMMFKIYDNLFKVFESIEKYLINVANVGKRHKNLLKFARGLHYFSNL